MAYNSDEHIVGCFSIVVLVSSSMLGIVISLHSSSFECLYIRLVFVLSMALLALGTISTLIAVYDYSQLLKRAYQAHQAEFQEAIENSRYMRTVSSGWRKRTGICERLSYMLLIASLLLLVTYSALITLM